MNFLDKVIQEWSHKTDKGYPDVNSKEDMDLFESMFGFKLEENNPAEKEINFSSTGLEQDDIDLILSVYSNLSEKEQLEIRKHYRKYNISSFKTNLRILQKIFEPFFYISNNKAGRGRGEFLPLLTLVNSKSGGIVEKDIIVGNEVIEIKELDKGKYFRAAKSGNIANSEFTEIIETFCNQLKELGIDKKRSPEIGQILNYFNTKYKAGNVSMSFVNKLVEVAKNIEDLHEQDIEDSVEYVKVRGKRYRLIHSEEEEINIGSTIKIGEELSSTKVALIKLRKNKLVQNPNALTEAYLELIDEYLGTLDYLLVYSLNKPNSGQLFTAKEAKTKINTRPNITQGSLRIGFKL